jgi:hypothetical protein
VVDVLRLSAVPFRPVVPAGRQLRRIRLGQTAVRIEEAVFGIASGLDVIARKLGRELDLALDPARYREVPVMSELTQKQVLGAIAEIADQLKVSVVAITNPPLGPYMTAESSALLETSAGRLSSIASVARARGAETLPIDKRSVVDVYGDVYLTELTSKIVDAERFVVGLEQGAVDLKEPAEKEREAATKILAGLGVVAAVGLLVYLVS